MKIAKYIDDFGTNKRGVWIRVEADGVKKQIDVTEDLSEHLPKGKVLSDVCK